MGCLARAAVLLATAASLGLCISSTTGQTNEPVPIERDFSVRTWRKEHGLPDDRVLSLLCDHRGFLWIGTRKGVSRFDGRSFVTWSRSTDSAFVNEECRALAEDRDGVIWVGTEQGLVCLGTSIIHHAVGSVPSPQQPPSRAYEPRVAALLVTPANELLVATTSGLLRRSPAGEWKRQWVENCPVSALTQAADGSIWIGSAHRPFRLDPLVHDGVLPFSEQVTPEDNWVHALASDRKGTVYAIIGKWVGNQGRLFRLTPAGWERVSEETIRNDGSPPRLLADARGGVWYPLDGGRLVREDEHQRVVYQLPAALSDSALFSLTQDHEGNFWLGTARDGLVCLSPRPIRTLTTRDGLKNNNVWTLWQDSQDALWVGTDTEVTGFVPAPAGGFSAATTHAFKDVRALTQDAAGRLWVGTRAGLHVRSGADLAELRFPGEWFNTKIRALYAGRDGAVWAATAVGLHRLREGQTNTWRFPQGLPNDDVRVVLEDHKGEVWVGTDGGGVARLTKNGFERFDESKGLSSLRVWALHEDAEGALWIGTDRGLNCLRNGIIRALTTEQGLPVNLVNGIVEDAHGCLWIGHDRGIYRVTRDQLVAFMDGLTSRVRCVAYDEEDGLLGVETNGQISYPPAIALRDGRLAFATVAGVAIIDPNRLPDHTNGPPASVERLLGGGQLLFAGYPGHTNLSRARVPSDRRGIVEVRFTAPTFHAADKVRFRYRLLGLSTDWIEAGTLRQASYANLPEGDYTFEIVAVNKHGYESASPARLTFQIEPYWHERTEVRAGAALGFVLLLSGGIGWRLHSLRRIHHLEQQAARAEERARLAKDLHDSLGADLTELTLLSNLGEQTPPSPDQMARRFEQLSQRTHETLHSLRDLIWTTHPRADSVEELASRLCEHAERLLRAAGINCRFDLPAQLPEVVIGPIVRRHLLLATSEAVHNAVRHARPTEVWLRVRLEGNVLEIAVEDNGCGFDPAGVAERRSAGHRLGLASMRQRIESVGGQYLLTGAKGRGTRVTFRVPLSAA